MNPPKIVFTCGDLNGVGLEIIRKALLQKEITDLAEYSIFGPDYLLTPYFKGIPLKIIDIGVSGAEITPGKCTEQSGEISFRSIETAVETTKAGWYDAVVTAPLCKEALNTAGHLYPGHTEMLMDLCSAEAALMMFLSQNMIVGLITVHIPLCDVPLVVTKEKALKKIRLLHKELTTRFKHIHPKIALCSMNPHAGENGMFGNEEITALIPAAETARSEGIDITDPLPADTLFKKASLYSAILAVYHDQGLIPAKLAPGGSVNYTGGLPIIRTSPDHGTAFDIAGKDIADASGMVNAIKWAVKLCR